MPQNFPEDSSASFITLRSLSSGHDTPSTNLIVCVAREQSLTIGAPSQADTFWLTGLLSHLHILRLELINLALLLKVEDNDTAGGGSAEPVTIWREDKGVNLVTSIKGIEMFRLVQVPKHRGTILTTGGTQ
jgi:hypothetical protein